MPSDNSINSAECSSTNRSFSSRVRNDLFDPRLGFDLGHSKLVLGLWQIVKWAFFLTPLPWPSAFKSALLRAFGARIGRKVYWKPRVNIHIPWKLSVGDYTWVGEEVNIVNFAPVSIGANCCLSQRTFICSGNHDFRSLDMRYRHVSVIIKDGVWLGAASFVAPGTNIGIDAVICACTVVKGHLDGEWVYEGHPCRPVRRRWDGEARKTT